MNVNDIFSISLSDTFYTHSSFITALRNGQVFIKVSLTFDVPVTVGVIPIIGPPGPVVVVPANTTVILCQDYPFGPFISPAAFFINLSSFVPATLTSGVFTLSYVASP